MRACVRGWVGVGVGVGVRVRVWVCFLRFSEIRETCALFDTDAKESCLEMTLLR